MSVKPCFPIIFLYDTIFSMEKGTNIDQDISNCWLKFLIMATSRKSDLETGIMWKSKEEKHNTLKKFLERIMFFVKIL